MNIRYENFLSPKIQTAILNSAVNVKGVEGLKQIGALSGIETIASLTFVKELYLKSSKKLNLVLEQRAKDRKFIDERTKSCAEYNKEFNLSLNSADYQTVIGMVDDKDRVVWGPKLKNYFKAEGKPVATIPEFLAGNHVTLFGPPDSAKLAINAMNCFHRQLPGEAPIIKKLLEKSPISPKWGADDEDSKTPFRLDLMQAALNLKSCFDETLTFEDKKKYFLESEKLALPIKRFPGLALPCTFLFYDEMPIPLHLYDFALHLYAHSDNAKALTFYVPKIENEEEAAYLKFMIEQAEQLIHQENPKYKIGTVKLILVLENPRALFRVNEIMDELYPYFAGASLGWHDFLASTARCFKEDSNYRIPVKADPDIVINYIKASHELLAQVVGGRGGIKIGGMYGVLPISNDLQDASFQLTLKGYFRDVVTQLKRGLDGFWVAHPDFVRIGIAIVEAWKKYKSGSTSELEELVTCLLNQPYRQEVLDFIKGSDIPSLETDHPLFARSLLAAVNTHSKVISNNDPEEIRYNIFQTLQYLADWLSGNGCVALPAHINDIAVRVMDDLATAERSRWEVWHELKNNRFDLFHFLAIAHEEYAFIRKNQSSKNKLVQVKWDERTALWYPVAFKVMIKLMTDLHPVEFATELLLPFTDVTIREQKDPWQAVSILDCEKYALSHTVLRFNYYFEICGCLSFAKTLSCNTVINFPQIQQLIMDFDLDEVVAAASFHGDIGGSKIDLDAMAQVEQEKINPNPKLSLLAQKYLEKFRFKFLVSAKGKSDLELLAFLEERIKNNKEQELNNAKNALFEITQKRIKQFPINNLRLKLNTLFESLNINAAQICFIDPHGLQQIELGECDKDTYFQIASLSKTFASSLALDFFSKLNISLNTKVNDLLSKTSSKYRIPNGEDVELLHLMNHTALNLHYVNGISLNDQMPKIEMLLNGNSKYVYHQVTVLESKPGTKFNYSGGGFLVLEHILQVLSGRTAQELIHEYLTSNQLSQIDFNQMSRSIKHAKGFADDGSPIEGGRKMFPAFAAGASATASTVGKFLKLIEEAYHNIKGCKNITHQVACTMLHATDLGSKEFMGANMGVGVFVAEAEDNSFIIHQGANDGFRSLFLHCFKGPDRGKGLVVLSNADLKGVIFNASVAQLFLRETGFSGIDFSAMNTDFSTENLSPEKIVNLGYKKLIFDAFIPRQPEKILLKGPLDPLASFNCCIGAKVLSVTNERFARAENLISQYLPLFDPTLFGKEGKIMDSWETVRHNYLPADILTLRLSRPSTVNFIRLSTKFHLGNHTPKVSINILKCNDWIELLPILDLDGHSEISIKLENPVTNVRDIQVISYPDGGLTRLGLYETLPKDIEAQFKILPLAKCITYAEKIPYTTKPLNIPVPLSDAQKAENLSKLKVGVEYNAASAYYGAKVLSASNEHYSLASTMLSPFAPIHMFDGLETARSRTAGHFDQVIIQLSNKTLIHRYEFNFSYYVNNNPKEISVFGFDGKDWHQILDHHPVKRYAENCFAIESSSQFKFEQIKIQTWPDGGLNRFKAYSISSSQ